MSKRTIALGVMVIFCLSLCLGILAGCGEEIDKTMVYVVVNSKCKEKFLAEEFTSEDFGWDNIETIGYGTWYTILPPERGELIVYLKKPGKKSVKDAVAHFENLYFVRESSSIPAKYANGYTN